MSEQNRQAFEERLDRIAGILSGIVAHAEVSSRTRCPYRDRHDRCTALFRCRNQMANGADPDHMSCGHDGAFDYRTAWETDARAGHRVRKRIASIREEAESRRRVQPGGVPEAAPQEEGQA